MMLLAIHRVVQLIAVITSWYLHHDSGEDDCLEGIKEMR